MSSSDLGDLDPRTRVLSFSHHAKIFAAVNALLALIDIVTGHGLWFYWPLFGWGVGLIVHYVRSFGFAPWVSAEWEAMMIREMERRQDWPSESEPPAPPAKTD